MGYRRVFSTYVEVFLLDTTTLTEEQRFLHVCGGVSCDLELLQHSPVFSPRMWRCFLTKEGKISDFLVFSTYVEVFPAFEPS